MTRRILLAGGLLAVVAFLLVDHGAHLGPSVVPAALMGVCFGAVLGLVPDRGPGWQAGAFLAGFALSWFGYALRAGVLPDIPLGTALAALLVIAVTAGICAATRGRMPLWAGLLGIGAFAGAYESTYDADPTSFLTQSPTAAASILIAVAIGFLVALLVVELGPRRAEATVVEREPSEPSPPSATEPPPDPPTPAPDPGRHADDGVGIDIIPGVSASTTDRS